MVNYCVEGTKSTPSVELNYGDRRFIFKGQSYPENAFKVYEPIYNWIDEYFSENLNALTTVDFYLSYINTSSTKCLMMLLGKLNKKYLQGQNIKINWHYDEENGFDYEMGNDFKEDIDIPFEFIAINNSQ